MAWIEIHQELREHRKLYACAERLKISRIEMLGTIITLWLWALDNVPDGVLTGISRQTIARVCDWNVKKADVLVEALTSTGWLDRNGDTLMIHDWAEYVGKLMERRKKDRERKKKPCGVPQDFRRKSDENPALQYHNSTITVPTEYLSTHNTIPSTDITPPGTPDAPKSARAFDAESFSLFWEAYPKTKHPDREAAWNAWKALSPTPEAAMEILRNLKAWKLSGCWDDEGGRYIPRPEDFLRKPSYREVAPSGRAAIPKGASGQLGEAELEAIRIVLQED